jgi:hypothetical protein
MEKTTLVLLLLVPLMVWRIYSRLKRLMSRTQLHLWRAYAAAVLLPLILGVLAAQSLAAPLTLGALALGAVIGIALGLWSMKLSRLENTAEGFFYTPSMHIGLVVSMVCVGRLLYRGFDLYLQMHNGMPVPPSNAPLSPLTALPLANVFCYYASYAVQLIRWRRSQQPVAPLGLDLPLPPL